MLPRSRGGDHTALEWLSDAANWTVVVNIITIASLVIASHWEGERPIYCLLSY